MLKRHPYIVGMGLAFGGIWLFHKVLPGKGLGQPGSVFGG